MSKMKKFMLMIVIIAFAIILGMSNKVSANHESTSGMDVGKSKTIGYDTMAGADNIYCVAHGQTLNQPVDYKVLCWVEIKGSKIVKSNKPVTTKDSESNAILAALLGGAVTQGYGSANNYNAAQQGVYGFWNKWCKEIGNKYGCYGYGENDNQFSDNTSQNSSNKFIAQAKAVAKKNEYHVKIYYLSSGIASWQKLILVEPLENTPPDEPKPGQTEVTGYVNISGYVWEDIANSKNNTINSKYEEGDLRVEGIKVYWKDSNGNKIGETTTNKNGEYKLTTTIALYNHPYGIKDQTKYDQINNSHIEFEYNGFKYTTVKYNGNLSNSDTSKGKENANQRKSLDDKFDRVENQTVYDGNKAIISKLPNTKISDANYTEDLAVSASTQKIVTLLMDKAEKNKWTETKEFCTDHCKVGEGPHVVKVIKTSGESTITLYCNGKIDINNVNNEHIEDSLINSIKELVGDEINTAEGSQSHYYSAGETNGPTHRDCRKGAEKPYVWNINNMNLGLVKREQPDAAISSDIEKVRVIAKNQEYTYIYGNRGIQNNNELFDYKVKFGDKYKQVYSRPINPADIAYVNNTNNENDLQVYVTYNIILKNQSNTLQMKINSIVNYYDSNYSIWTGEKTSTTSGWQETSETNNGYKVARMATNITLQPNAQSDMIKLEFKVSANKIKELQNENEGFTFTNYTEIYSFTTLYGKNTICAERESAETKKLVNKQYAGLDKDSTPGNAVPGKEDTYEDDTDRAPSFQLKRDPNHRTVSGIVYEDTQTSESRNDKERLGNGQKDGNEKGVENVKVELIDSKTGEIANIYYVDATGSHSKQAITYSDANGNYSFAGVIPENYILKYTYGNADKDENEATNEETKINNNVINARNYKSTIVTDENVKKAIQGNASEIWYLDMDTSKKTSIAVDDLKQRLETENLKYSNYENKMNMSAYSKEFKAQIEYTKETSTKVNDKGKIDDGSKDGIEFQKDFSAFDFGIIERPREDLVINKTISKVKVTLANGQVLIEGDPRNDKMNYVKAIGFNTNNREIAVYSETDKMLTMEIDSELLQGAKLEVWYLITLTNNSEKDYEYEKDYTDIIKNKDNETTQNLNYITKDSQANYYYYGNNSGLNIINKSAELVVDYMSEKLDCDINNKENKDWFKLDSDGTPIDRDYLKDKGYISSDVDSEDATYKTIGNQKVQILATKAFADVGPAGETKTTSMYASTVLANKEDNTTYDNHVEIIEINGKTARTIKEVINDSREQSSKKYRVGNYLPKLGSTHEQDDDRVNIIVTPPTGIKTYTTIYIISAVVGAIVLAGGIVLIKKKFIKK